MIDTDKIMRTTKILLHLRHINKNEADGYLELIAEVKRLQDVAYRRICMIGERDKEIARLLEVIMYGRLTQAIKQDGSL